MSRTANFGGKPAFPPRVLRAARAIAATLFDDGKGLPAEQLDAFATDLGEFGRYIGKTRLAIRATIFILQWSPVWVIRRPVPFSWLSAQDRVRYLEKAEHQSMPLVFQGMKTFFGILWYEQSTRDLPVMRRELPRAGEEWLQLRRKA